MHVLLYSLVWVSFLSSMVRLVFRWLFVSGGVDYDE
ncbi:hypothetical protein SAMN05443507_10495 [Alicyclobacillus tolerans]|uniref:Uncharacterized protein n=1 Tax=Alicyclobacillus tolerans TaxID=90970 RepID=A0A1M6MKG3_9BACL|nr:hypothetical protein SAMN05443507_10495 [Alicyclobacillus montanus]